MKLAKNNHTTHAINPKMLINLSFCGLAGYWYVLYEGSGDSVTCKTCKKLMQKYIIRKLKNEVM